MARPLAAGVLFRRADNYAIGEPRGEHVAEDVGRQLQDPPHPHAAPVRPLRHEQAELDYKELLDLGGQRTRLELAKDVAAMQVGGGYIVVGATDRGELSGAMTYALVSLFDEATVRDVLLKWLPEPLDIHVARHIIDEQNVVLVHVGPNPHGLCIMKADGQYHDDATGKSVTVFRRGDIYARHGSKSERMVQEDIPRILARLVAREKETWREEIAATVLPLVQRGAQAQRVAQGPAEGFSLELPLATFEASAVELLGGRPQPGRPGQEESQVQRILKTYRVGGLAMVPPNRDCGEGVLAGVERSVAGLSVSVGTGPGESGGLDEHVVAFRPARSAFGQPLKIPKVATWQLLVVGADRAPADKST